jgi:hypothetical protein
MIEKLHKASGDMNIRVSVVPARFDQDYLCAGILAQPIGGKEGHPRMLASPRQISGTGGSA